MLRSDAKRARLCSKWQGRARLEFRHVGARCPSCGFVFTKGFSTLTYPKGTSGLDQKKESLTLCTRCRVPLAVSHVEGPAPLRVLDETAKLLLTEADREAMRDMAELLDLYTQDWA